MSKKVLLSGVKPTGAPHIGNYFGDSSEYGNACDFNSMNVTYNITYAQANPTVICWAPNNV